MAGGWSALERSLRKSGAERIAGVDEVGRGPLAGPVVVCAVIMPAGRRAIAGVTDSKQLTAAHRGGPAGRGRGPFAFTHLPAPQNVLDLGFRLLLAKKKNQSRDAEVSLQPHATA